MAVDTTILGSRFAIVRFGGKQYRVIEGQKLAVDKLPGNVGDEVIMSDVLLLGQTPQADDSVLVGTPLVPGASVKARILGHQKEKKVRIFKKKRRTGYTKRQGHRQQTTQVCIESIVSPGQ